MTPQQLKNSILQRAIEGRLVEQRPEEGTAQDLLKEIQAEKTQLVKEGKIKKSKALPPITEEEKPFDIPETWEWVRLDNIAEVKSSKRVFEEDYVSSGVPFFRSKEIVNLSKCEEIKTELFISREHFKKFKETYGAPEAGDILVTSVGTLGKTWISDGREFYYKDGNITQIKKNRFILPEYINYFIQSDLFMSQVRDKVSGTAYNALTIIKLKNMIVPLPPRAEQRRIVAKIEELLPLIDKYDKAYTKLTDFNTHFPEAMKKSLLQYAIQGKLVEQRADEGTAQDLIKDIQAEKERLIAEKKIKKPKALPPITEEEIPFEIPEGWEWVRLDSIVYNHGQEKPSIPFTYIDIGSVDNSKQRLGNEDNIVLPENAPSRARKIVEAGDIIYATVRPYLHNMCIIDREFLEKPIASTGFAVMTPHTGVNNKYLFYYLLSPTFDSYANSNENSKGVAYPAINDKALYSAIIALPPLAEQHRIVAKLEELLLFCDWLIK